jgi:hypothetical protein
MMHSRLTRKGFVSVSSSKKARKNVLLGRNPMIPNCILGLLNTGQQVPLYAIAVCAA